MKTNFKNVLNKFGYPTTYANDIVDRCIYAKRKPIWGNYSLYDILSKHPNWNEEKQYIVFSDDVERDIDMGVVADFYAWVFMVKLYDVDECRLLSDVLQCNQTYADEETIKKANQLYKIHTDKTPFRTNQKTSRIVRKLCTVYNLDELDDFEKAFAKYADAMNPTKIKRHTVVSINPVDYITMSIAHNWTSCATIDKRNTLGLSTPHEVLGSYCSGTLSYAFDSSTVVVYYVDGDYNGTDYELQSKVKRCLFSIGEEKIAQYRLYPDGRNNDGFNTHMNMRKLMQEIVANGTDNNNYWKNKIGTNVCCSVIDTIGTHYRDYERCEECNVSILHGSTNCEKIRVGSNPVCPACGSIHNVRDNLLCDRCR